jgi:transcriptional regulator with XRE-family HTH domain
MQRQRFRIDGPRVRELRERAAMPQKELATGAGVSQAGLSNIELGRKGASSRTILALARELGVGFDDITIDTMKQPRALSA